MMTNWIAGPNPFGLASPPDFFLTDLAAFDPDLVIFPSAEQAVYRLCRRVRRGPALTHVGKIRHQLGGIVDRFDHKILVALKLVPVVSLLPHPQWGPKILADLAEADLWRHGGADAATATMDQREADVDQRLDRDIADEATARGHSAWSAYKWNSGQRIDLGSVPRHRPSTSRPLHSGTASAIVSENTRP